MGNAAGAIQKSPNGGSRRRKELLAIALEVFAAKGFATATVRDVAEAAGILSGSLYHHFRSKEEMLNEILFDFLTRLLGRIEKIEAASSSPSQLLDALVLDAFDTIQSESSAVALFQYEAPAMSSQPGFEYLDPMSRAVEDLWMRALEAGRQSGEFRDELDSRLAYRLIRDAVWSTVRWYRKSGRYSVGTIGEQYLAILRRGVTAPQS